jgi:hypothetical protein
MDAGGVPVVGFKLTFSATVAPGAPDAPVSESEAVCTTVLATGAARAAVITIAPQIRLHMTVFITVISVCRFAPPGFGDECSYEILYRLL